MKKFTRILVSTFFGGLICAILSALVYILFTLLDGISLEEAIGYGAVVGVMGSFIGAGIGFVVGVGKLGLPGGAIVGGLATLAVVVLYVLTFSRPGQVNTFISASWIFIIVLIIPTTLTGVLTALLQKRLARS